MQTSMKWELSTKQGGLPGVTPDGATETLCGRLWRSLGLGRTTKPGSAAFTLALVSLSAKLAKSDGVASRIEAEAFERLHEIVPDERDTIRQMFDRAARDVTGFDEYAHEVVRLLGRDPARLRDVLEGLFHIAAADGILHPEEERHLARAAEAFGISRADFRSLRGLFVHDPDDPYTVLGLSPDVDDATLKSTFKRLVRQHHPDVLAGHGASPEFVRLATAKLAEINAAFDRIVAERAG